MRLAQGKSPETKHGKQVGILVRYAARKARQHSWARREPRPAKFSDQVCTAERPWTHNASLEFGEKPRYSGPTRSDRILRSK